MDSVDLSVVIPAFNEAASLEELLDELTPVLEKQGRGWEIILVDDGSRDDTTRVIVSLSEGSADVHGVILGAHQGKAAALAAGFKASAGRIIVTLDADMQDDPRDLHRFLETIETGFDLVCGWKRPRRDPWLRRLSSRVFNTLTSMLLGPRLHDHNCGFKAYRREVLEEVTLYGDLHRFATFLAHARGFRVTEVTVNHRPRRHGASRYGVERVWRGALDLFTVSLLARGSRRVFRFFAATGAPLAALGLLLCLCLLPASPAASFQRIPLFLGGILAFLVGVQILATGLLCELILSLWWRSRPRARKEERCVSILLSADAQDGAAEAAEACAVARPDLSFEVLTERRGIAVARGAHFVLVERAGLADLPAIVAHVTDGDGHALVIGPSGKSAGAGGELLADFPGFPRSTEELRVWCTSAGWELKPTGEGTGAIGLLAHLKHLPLSFLARYHARPLHFFGVCGGIMAFLGGATGLGIKLSAVSGQLRYLLMELALGLAVAGVELFVAGLLGDLLAYVRSMLARRQD